MDTKEIQLRPPSIGLGTAISGLGVWEGWHALCFELLHFYHLTSCCQQLWCGILWHRLEDLLKVLNPVQTPVMGTTWDPTVHRASSSPTTYTELGMLLNTWMIWKSPTGDKLFFCTTLMRYQEHLHVGSSIDRREQGRTTHKDRSATGQGSVCMCTAQQYPLWRTPVNPRLTGKARWQDGEIHISFDASNNYCLTISTCSFEFLSVEK